MHCVADRDLVQNAIDAKTKPIGSLGRIEALAAQIARAQRSLAPAMSHCSLTIFAADHGIADEGVSAYPQAVTRQMVLNFLLGGAAANAFARAVGATVQVVDAGVAGEPIDHPDLLDRRIVAGTRNSAVEAAMSTTQLDQALAAGRSLGNEAAGEAVCFGEMGIANTSSAALVVNKLGVGSLDALVGRGTGVGDAGLAHKRTVLGRAASRTTDRLAAPDALREYGGFEIAMMVGALLGAADAGKIIIVDGFIATAAAAAALDLNPRIRSNLVFAHRSAERGHAALLAHLRAEPLLDFGMRLGEGTGALLAWPIVKSAAAMLREMATFDGAGVSRPA